MKQGPQHAPHVPEDAFFIERELALTGHEARSARLLVWTGVALLVALLVWAALAEIDEVTRGEGKVIPAGHVQVVQAVDGGVVSEIKVQEGDVVDKSSLLLRIDATRFQSSLRENRAEYLSLLGKAARLRALANNGALSLPAEVVTESPQVARTEQLLYENRRQEIAAQLGIARQQLEQRRQELNEVESRYHQAVQALTLTERELRMTEPLLADGAVSEVEVLRLRRDVSRFKGERDAAEAQQPRIESAIREAERKIQEVDLTFRGQARNELADTEAKLSGLEEGSVGLADRVLRTEVRSPVRGTVKTLKVKTLGGVVQPGTEVVEIVPLEDSLLLEARIQPKDIAFLRPGQRARVRFTAYDFTKYGGLEAVLEQIGADTVTDDKGNAYYLVRVRTASTFVGNKSRPILPGMVAEVDILTGKRTVLSYLLKPVLRARQYALTER